MTEPVVYHMIEPVDMPLVAVMLCRILLLVHQLNMNHWIEMLAVTL